MRLYNLETESCDYSRTSIYYSFFSFTLPLQPMSQHYELCSFYVCNGQREKEREGGGHLYSLVCQVSCRNPEWVLRNELLILLFIILFSANTRMFRSSFCFPFPLLPSHCFPSCSQPCLFSERISELLTVVENWI